MTFIGIPRMYFISNRIASGTYKKTENDLRIGVLAVFRPAWDANVVFSGFKVHRGGIVEDDCDSAAKNTLRLFVGYLLYIVFDIVLFL